MADEELIPEEDLIEEIPAENVENEVDPEEVEIESNELEGEENSKEPEEESKKEDPPPKKKLTQKERQSQINQLIWEKKESERKSDEATERSLAAAERAEKALTKLEEMQSIASNPKPIDDDFETQGEFIEALTDWKMATAGKIKPKSKKLPSEDSAVIQRNEAALRAHGVRSAKAKTKYKDYENKEKMVAGELAHYNNTDAVQLIVESELGPRIINFLHANPNTLAKLNTLSGLSIAKEIGRIEDKLEKSPFKNKTGAPAAISKGGGGGYSPPKDLSKMSDEQYADARNKELAGK